jgi:hypothetical protein
MEGQNSRGTFRWRSGGQVLEPLMPASEEAHPTAAPGAKGIYDVSPIIAAIAAWQPDDALPKDQAEGSRSPDRQGNYERPCCNWPAGGEDAEKGVVATKIATRAGVSDPPRKLLAPRVSRRPGRCLAEAAAVPSSRPLRKRGSGLSGVADGCDGRGETFGLWRAPLGCFGSGRQKTNWAAGQ